MDKQSLYLNITQIAGQENVILDEPLKNYTSMKVGGPCDILVKPADLDQLRKIYQLCRSENYPVFFMGNGTNLVVRDKGIQAVVILSHPHLQKIEKRDSIITAECGILLKDLAHFALSHSLSGLEFAAGIPGTLGGAVIMNAGAYGGEMKDVVTRTWYLDRDGEVKVLSGPEHQFAYRKSYISEQKGLVLRSEMKLRPGTPAEIQAIMNDLQQKREDKQPLDMPSAGSVFKRPEGHFTGKLIQDCGLKGYSIGGAQVSVKHSGFIVNTGNASARDIIDLIQYIQDTVFDNFGVRLETEVRVVGDE